MSKVPGYWADESSGILVPVVKRYIEGQELDSREVFIVRCYLHQWMEGPWQGPTVGQLRAEVGQIRTHADLQAWFERAFDAGIDPL